MLLYQSLTYSSFFLLFFIQAQSLYARYLHTLIARRPVSYSDPFFMGFWYLSGITLFLLGCSCGGSDRNPPYQVQHQKPLNQLTKSLIQLFLLKIPQPLGEVTG